MIGFQVKGMFFDRKVVKSATDRATRKVFSRFGAFVRTRSRQSIRRSKKSSRPGQPPRAHRGDIKKIYFAYESHRRSLVVGPVWLSKIGSAPEALEHGGESQVVSRRRGRQQVRTIRVAARPFMQPAFRAEKPKLQGMWANSVK